MTKKKYNSIKYNNHKYGGSNRKSKKSSSLAPANEPKIWNKGRAWLQSAVTSAANIWTPSVNSYEPAQKCDLKYLKKDPKGRQYCHPKYTERNAPKHGLPVGWTSGVDDEGRTYYTKTSTKVSKSTSNVQKPLLTCEPKYLKKDPKGRQYCHPKYTERNAPKHGLPEGWTSRVDDEGRTYYTKTSTRAAAKTTGVSAKSTIRVSEKPTNRKGSTFNKSVRTNRSLRKPIKQNSRESVKSKKSKPKKRGVTEFLRRLRRM